MHFSANVFLIFEPITPIESNNVRTCIVQHTQQELAITGQEGRPFNNHSMKHQILLKLNVKRY